MKTSKSITLKVIKITVLIATYSFLIWKISNITYWQELKNAFTAIEPTRILFLALLLLLVPVNWGLEARKWQLLCSKITNLSFFSSWKAVLAGLNTGLITPNRIGEFGGRILFLPATKRKSGIVLTLLGSFIQTLVLALMGTIGAYFYTSWYVSKLEITNYLLIIAIGATLFLFIYLFIPQLGKIFSSKPLLKKFDKLTRSITSFSRVELIYILLISILRYAVFSFQYYLMLRFFGIHLIAVQAVISIPTMYLLVTITPSIFASEPAIRGSYAVLIMSIFSSNEIGILLSGILIWLVNFVIPMLVGSYFLAVGESGKKVIND